MILCRRSGHTKASPRSWMPRSQSFLMSSRLPLPRPATSTWQRIWRLQRKTVVAQSRPRFRPMGCGHARKAFGASSPVYGARPGPCRGQKATPRSSGSSTVLADPCHTSCNSARLGRPDTVSRPNTKRSTPPTTHATPFKFVGALALPGNAHAGAVRSHNSERPSGPGQDAGRRRSDRRVGRVAVYPGSV